MTKTMSVYCNFLYKNLLYISIQEGLYTKKK